MKGNSTSAVHRLRPNFDDRIATGGPQLLLLPPVTAKSQQTLYISRVKSLSKAFITLDGCCKLVATIYLPSETKKPRCREVIPTRSAALSSSEHNNGPPTPTLRDEHNKSYEMNDHEEAAEDHCSGMGLDMEYDLSFDLSWLEPASPNTNHANRDRHSWSLTNKKRT